MRRSIFAVSLLVSVWARSALAQEAQAAPLPADAGTPAFATASEQAGAPSQADAGMGALGPQPLAPLNGSWTGESNLGGSSAYADGATTWRGAIWLFGVGTGDHKIYYNRLPVGSSTWTGWYLLLPNSEISTTYQVTPVVYEDKLYVFYVDTYSHHVYYKYTADGSAWSGSYGMDSWGTTTRPVTAVEFYGRLYVFSVQGTGTLRHYCNVFNGATWTGKTEVDGGATSYQGDSATIYQGKLWLFGLATDGSHWYTTFDGYPPWSAWTPVPGGSVGEGYPDKAIVYNNRLHLFGIGMGDHGHYVNVYDGASWSYWYPISGMVASTASDTAAVANNRLYLMSIETGTGYHNVASCLSDVSCGGGTDNGDAIIYQGSCGNANHVHLTAESAKAETLYPWYFAWPLYGYTLNDHPATCVWLRSGYRFTYTTQPRLGGTGGTISVSGTFGLPATKSFLLSRNPPGFGPQAAVGSRDCGPLYWSDEVQGITHSESHWYMVTTGGHVRRYSAVEAELCSLNSAGDAEVELGVEHAGSPAFHDGYLYVPVYFENPDRNYVYVLNRDLALEQVLNLGNVRPSWVAINPVDGFMYASKWLIDGPTLHVFERNYVPGVDYPVSVSEMPYTVDLSRYFSPPSPNALTAVQAGVFSHSGYVYLFDGDEGGGKRVFVFKVDGFEAFPVTWWAVNQPDEAEGIFLWDFNVRTDLPRFIAGGGQLHLLIRDNQPGTDHADLFSYSVPHWAY